MQYLDAMEQGPYFIVACANHETQLTDVHILPFNESDMSFSKETSLNLPLKAIYSLYAFRRNYNELYIAVVDDLEQEDIDTYASNRLLIYAYSVHTSGIKLNSQLLYASYEQHMAILDLVYD
jgi:hypothetical protein